MAYLRNSSPIRKLSKGVRDWMIWRRACSSAGEHVVVSRTMPPPLRLLYVIMGISTAWTPWRKAQHTHHQPVGPPPECQDTS